MIPVQTILAAAALALAACAPQGADNGSRATGGGMGMMENGAMGMRPGGGMGAMGGDMRTIRGLLTRHEAIERRVEDIPGGVRTWTTSEDPEVAMLIRRHVREMRTRFERGQPIRAMDPVFRELFRNRDRATMEIADIPGGARVEHRSDDPEIAGLIRQHARRFVSEAAQQGMRRAMRPTPLPEGYRSTE